MACGGTALKYLVELCVLVDYTCIFLESKKLFDCLRGEAAGITLLTGVQVINPSPPHDTRLDDEAVAALCLAFDWRGGQGGSSVKEKEELPSGGTPRHRLSSRHRDSHGQAGLRAQAPPARWSEFRVIRIY